MNTTMNENTDIQEVVIHLRENRETLEVKGRVRGSMWSQPWNGLGVQRWETPH